VVVADAEWDAMGDSHHIITDQFGAAVGRIRPTGDFHPDQVQQPAIADDDAANTAAEANADLLDLPSSFVTQADEVPHTPSPPAVSPSSPAHLRRDSSANESLVPPPSSRDPARGLILDALNTPLQSSSKSADGPSTPPKAAERGAVATALTPDGKTLQYMNMDWQFLAPHWLWNKSTKCMYRLTCNLAECSKSITDSRRALLFLALRGQPFRSPRPVFRTLENIMHEAKAIMLDRIMQVLEENMGMTGLEALFKLIIAPYSNELKRLSAPSSDSWSAVTTPTSGPMSGESTPRATTVNAGGDGSRVGLPNQPQQQSTRQTWVGSIFSGGLSGTVSGSGQSASMSKSVSDNSYMDSEPIEPAHAMYLFLPNINSVGGKIRGHRRSDSSGGEDQIASGLNVDNVVVKVPLSGRRDSYGTMIISQTEMLSYIWLPIILQKPGGMEIDYIRWSLCTYVTALRGAVPAVPVHPAISILLLNLLVLEGRYAEMAHLVQLQFFPDSIEVAMAVLELSDIVSQNMIADANNQANNSGQMNSYEAQQAEILRDINMYKLSSSIQVLQQVGLDMLWRMQEKTTVVRWLLGRGRVLEAITLCMKVRGQFRQGLSPGSISGIDFYIAALEAINMINSDVFDEDSLSDENGSNRDEMPHDGNDATVDNTNSVDVDDAEAGWGDWDNDNLEWLDNKEYEEVLKSRRAELLHTVYKFIKDWDHSVLLPVQAVSVQHVVT
jgi:hypothetical protein